jgi:hypothetical protein
LARQAGKLDAPVLRLADAIGRRDEKAGLTAAGGLDRRGRYAVPDQSALDRIRATYR